MTRGRGAGGPGTEGGFTLVEVLVVLAILGTLIALTAAIIPRAMSAKAKLRTSSLLQTLGASLEAQKNNTEEFGRYPTSRLRDLRIGKVFVGKDVGQQNDLNVGIECVYFLLNNPLVQADQVTSDAELIGNTDNDNYRAARGNAQDTLAREYVDAWGQPLVYIHSNDYKDPKGLDTIVSKEDGRKISVRPKRLPASAGGGFMNPNSFQLFSVGPNGEQDPDDAEESDDIFYQGR